MMTSPKKFKSFSDVLIHYDIRYVKEELEIIKTIEISLEQNHFVLYKNRFFIEDLDRLFNALTSVLELCKLQLIELKLL
jgi:hypothetical protein